MNFMEKTGKWALYVVAAFVILEPIWMLTPFVGFLYGSVFNIDFLEANKATSWLLLFVFPTGRFMKIGLFLVISGLGFFLICAFKIYSAKIFKRGAVTTGIYKYLRHPQYTGLILAGIGLVIMWGRFISYLSFFIMIYLYYLLSKKEEKTCLLKYGEEYEKYRKKTIGIIPGIDTVEEVLKKSPFHGMPIPISISVGLLLVISLALGSGFMTLKLRVAHSAKLPVIQKGMEFNGKGIQFFFPKFPIMDKGVRLGFRTKYILPETFLKNIKFSKKITDNLNPFFESGANSVFIIFEPRLSIIEENGSTYVNFLMVPMKNFKNRDIKGLLRVERMLLDDEVEPVKGNIDVLVVKDLKKDKDILNRIESKIDVTLSRFY